MCIAVVLSTSVLVAEGQLGGQEVTATICGLFRDADTGQCHHTTLDLVAELEQPTGAWELVADEEYEVEVTLADSEGSRVTEVTALDPEGEIVDQVTADPPASTLTASGTFMVAQSWKLDISFEATGRIGSDGTATAEVKLTIKTIEPGEQPAPPETKLVIEALDMSQGGAGAPTYAIVEIWPPDDPQSMQWTSTDGQGKATFTGISRGQWIVHIIGIGLGGACDYEFSSVVVIHATKLESARIWQHRPIAGKLWFKDDAGQVVGGYPGEVTLELLQGGEPVEAVTPMVNTTANPDGSYPYSVPSQFLIAGDYVLRASLGQSTDNKNVTYPNHCAHALPQAHFTHRAPGAHAQVEGPELVIIVDDDPPEIP